MAPSGGRGSSESYALNRAFIRALLNEMLSIFLLVRCDCWLIVQFVFLPEDVADENLA